MVGRERAADHPAAGLQPGGTAGGPAAARSTRLDPRDPAALESATCGEHGVTAEAFVLSDDDGALFIPLSRAADVADVAATIRDTERSQAAKMNLGTTFRTQARLGEYLAARNSDATITFRQHLRAFGGEIEE
ncbi:hypothetical protein [Pseudarthrobacter cellobiosi]|uniref:hypothetical protein n=1 Tax=Pseudarthrobacter cellobiosi TaxID=2953654 RepID=UPI00208F92AA|nr:hypothetical protein [Pseudarthrobacter sp. HLT1-5]MCO4256342.1 hypothetical protein [Pseudarthrobacter sp. HLT1-5]